MTVLGKQEEAEGGGGTAEGDAEGEGATWRMLPLASGTYSVSPSWAPTPLCRPGEMPQGAGRSWSCRIR